MIRAVLLLVSFILLLGSCTQQLVCPAYQSSFIYDKEAMRKKFSYFKEDSTPKILTASKSKYLIAVPESYRKKMRNLKTVEAKPVYPVIPDSLKLDKGKDQLMAEMDVVVDSTQTSSDSVYAITKTKEKYNVDQDIYMWYFRDMLVLPDVRAAMDTQSKNKQAANASAKKKKKKGLFSFLKKKKPVDSLAVEEPVIAPTDSAASTPKKKKGLLGMFGGKKASKKAEPEKKKEDAKKEDEGF